jgi:hypothetical protein
MQVYLITHATAFLSDLEADTIADGDADCNAHVVTDVNPNLGANITAVA